MARRAACRNWIVQALPTARSMELADWLWFGWIFSLSVFIVLFITPNLGNYPNISGDDGWIMSASHKLASEGVFGSDLYRGFGNAEQHYFIALPVYHFFQAGVFALFGTGVVQARMVTLASGLLILWCVAWLARRWYGVAVAILATALLVFWRTNLLQLASGLSFLSISRTGRYDATAVGLALLALVLLEVTLDRERRSLAFATGVVAGIASLTQFFGAFVVPLIAAIVVLRRGRNGLRQPPLRWMAAGLAVVVLPYLVYIAAYWSDFLAQSELKAGRLDFGSPAFYVDNLTDEPGRYLRLFERPFPLLGASYGDFDHPLSPALFGVMALVAVVFLAARLKRSAGEGDRTLATSPLVLGLCLALFDSTNASLYTAIVWPLICIAIAAMLVAGLRWAATQRPLLAVVIALMVIAPLFIVGDEGVRAYRQEHRWSHAIVEYGRIADEIDELLPPGEPVAGSDRWWPALHGDHAYLSINTLARRLEGGVTLAELVEEYRLSALVIDDDARAEIGRLPPLLSGEFERLLETSDHAGTVSVHPYGQIDVYHVDAGDISQ